MQETDETEKRTCISVTCQGQARRILLLLLRCRWFCHFDDDNYVNVPALLRKLRRFDHREDWYLGKPSIPEPLEILDRDNMQVNLTHSNFCCNVANLPKRNLIYVGKIEDVHRGFRRFIKFQIPWART